MNRKISEEIRLQILHFLKQGLRSQVIASRLHLCRSTVIQWQHVFDRGDFRWLNSAHRASVSPERPLQAVRMFKQLGSYGAAARECGLKILGCLSVCQKYGKVQHPIVAKRARLSLHEDCYEIPFPC